MNNTKQNDGWSDFQSGPPAVPPTQWSTGSQQTGFSQWTSSGYNPQTGQHHSSVPAGAQNLYHAGFGSNGSPMIHHGQHPHTGHSPSVQQMYGQPHIPQMYGQGPNSQIPGQGPNPQMYGQGPNPQMYGQGLNPQMYGQGPNPQIYGQGPNPQMYGQSPNPQMPPNPQIYGHAPNPQITGQGPNPQTQQQPLETPEEIRRRKEREEQQMREAEITKRKLMRVKVAKHEGTGSSPSLESLIGFNPEPKSKPRLPSVTPTVKTEPRINSPKVEDKQVHQSPTEVRSGFPVEPVPTPPVLPSSAVSKTGVSYDELLSGSLVNLDKTVSGTIGKNDFKESSSRHYSHSGAAPLGARNKVFADSVKSRQWASTGSNGAFEGLFAQHAPPTAPPTHSSQNMGDDSFGEFQSMPVSVLPTTDGSFNQQTFHSTSSSQTLPPSSYQMYPSPAKSIVAHPQSRSPQVVHTSSFNSPVMMTEATPPANKETLPHWAISKNYPLPQVYAEVLKMCSKEDGNLLDTGTLFPILLSSGLDRAVLRDLWGVVNKEIPGTLVRHELLCLLAMIGTLQGGSPAVTLSDITTLMVPPPVTLTTGSKGSSPHSLNSKQLQQQHQEDFGDFQGSDNNTQSAAILSSAVLDSDPYSAFKSISHTSVNTVASNDPYSALRAVNDTPSTISSSNVNVEPDPLDPYSALRSSGDPTADTPSTSHGSLLPPGGNLTATPTTASSLLPTGGNLTATPTKTSSMVHIGSNAQGTSTSTSGWAAFSMLDQTKVSSSSNNEFGEFSAFTSVGLSSSVAPPTDSTSSSWANFVTATNTGSNSSDVFGDFSSFSASNSLASLSVTGPTPSLPSLSSTPLIPMTTATPAAVESPLLSDNKKYTVKPVEYFEVWRTCLVQCDELLGGCVSVLCDDNVSQSLLGEISSHPDSQERLKDMIEVYRFAKRVHFASRGPGRKHMTPEKSQSLMTTMMAIKQKWNKLCRVIPDNKMTELMDSPASHPIKEGDAEDLKCSLCLLPTVVSISTLVTIDGYSEQYLLPMEDSNGKTFHCQCMEFWIKAVARDLAAIP